MFLCSLSDSGLTIFPTHRLLTDLKDARGQERLGAAIKEHFEIEQIEHSELEPPRRAARDRHGLHGLATSSRATG